MLSDPFHGQQSGHPNNDGRKENAYGIGCEGLPFFHFEKICGNGPRIDPGAGQRNHDKKYNAQETKFLDFSPRSFFGPLGHKHCRFFIEPPLDQMSVDVLQKEHHDREHQHIGQKAGYEHHIFVHSLVHSIRNAHLGLPEGGKTPKYRYDQVFVQGERIFLNLQT